MGDFPNDHNFEVKIGDVGGARKRALDALSNSPPTVPSMGASAAPSTSRLPRPITWLVCGALLYFGYKVVSWVIDAMADFRRGGVTGTDVALLYWVATPMLLIGIAAATKAMFGSAKRHPFIALLCIAAPLGFGWFARSAERAASRTSTQNIPAAGQTAASPTAAVKYRARKKPFVRRPKGVAEAPVPAIPNADRTQQP